MPMYTLRFFVDPDLVADAPVMGIGPTGAIRYPLPVLQCEMCCALIPADMETKHSSFHAMLDQR